MIEAKNKACPFCGGQARVISRGYQDGGKWTDWVSVTCPAGEGGCGASQAATTEDAAWKHWNTRAGDRQPEAVQNSEAQEQFAPCPGSEATDKRLMSAVTGLMEIVEGVRNVRWAHEGVRLKDTPEWCELYCAWNAEKSKPLNDQAQARRAESVDCK